MKKHTHLIFTSFFLICLYNGLLAQQIIINGGNLNLENASLVVQDMNFVNNATFNSTNGNVVLSGTTATNIAGTTETSFSTLTITKTTNDVFLQQNADVTTFLQMQDGNLDVQTFELELVSPAIITGADATQYIRTPSTGVLTQTVAANAVVFPVGNSSYNPANMTNAGTSDQFSMRVEDQVLETYPAGTAVNEDVANRAWHIDEGTIGGSDVTLSVQWNATEELTNFDRTASGIGSWESTAWNPSGSYTAATANGTSWTQTLSGLTSFDVFVVQDETELLGGLLLQLSVFMQGPHNGTDMDTDLRTGGLIPLSDPYGLGATVTSIPTDVVDWIKIEVRDPTNSSTILGEKAGFLRKDGQILDSDGNLGVRFSGLGVSSGFVAVRHRNHLGIMTANAISF